MIFKLPKEFLWPNIARGIIGFFVRPSRKLFWYNLLTVIVLMILCGYITGTIQNHINHRDLLQRGVPEFKEDRSFS